MASLLIQFADAEFDHLRWASFDDERGLADLNWQAASVADLSTIASQNPHPVVLLIPQQCVYLTQVELPEKAGRQVLSSIEFQVEDQLAQDIESQHFAIGDSTQNPIAIAVVEKSIMERCMALAQGHGLRLAQVMPELFLCPWPGDGVNLIESDDGYLVRYGAYRGFKCNSQALPAMLELAKHDVDFDKVRYFSTADNSPPSLDGFGVESYALNETRIGFFEAPFIDLQQRDFQLASAWQGLARAWKWIALLFALLLAVGAYNKAVALQDLEDDLAAVKTEQYELLKPYLPAGTQADDNLKKMLIARMKSLQSGLNNQGFMQLLLDFSAARSQYTAVEIDRIGFQNQRLNIDINSKQLKDIEALHATIQKQGINAKLENLSIKPELISGRLVLLGGEDG